MNLSNCMHKWQPHLTAALRIRTWSHRPTYNVVCYGLQPYTHSRLTHGKRTVFSSDSRLKHKPLLNNNNAAVVEPFLKMTKRTTLYSHRPIAWHRPISWNATPETVTHAHHPLLSLRIITSSRRRRFILMCTYVSTGFSVFHWKTPSNRPKQARLVRIEAFVNNQHSGSFSGTCTTFRWFSPQEPIKFVVDSLLRALHSRPPRPPILL